MSKLWNAGLLQKHQCARRVVAELQEKAMLSFHGTTPMKAQLAKATAAKPRVLASFQQGCEQELEGPQDRRVAEG